ncbi:MAG: hypothetical protein GX957_08430 [Clostridiaceae bacterium]|nr:hypothetical protein [Clostridiaceae bacterium]
MNKQVLTCNENTELCKACGGKCCKTMGGHYSPDDFVDLSLSSLIYEIEKGYISIDWWVGDVMGDDRENTYYLRTRNLGAGVIDPSWGGVCCLLTENGCSLSWEERPYGCRALVPLPNNECRTDYTKEDSCKEWYPYQDTFKKLIRRIRESKGRYK